MTRNSVRDCKYRAGLPGEIAAPLFLAVHGAQAGPPSLRYRAYLPRNFGALFSRNELIPSSRSSVLKQ